MPPRKRNVPTAKVDESTNTVDDTVKNQENLGSAPVVDRSEPVLVTDETGTTFDRSKSSPEIVDPNAEETEAYRARVRQTDAALNAKEGKDESDAKDGEFNLEFVESGFTVMGRVWKRGQVLKIDPEARNLEQDTEGNVWYDLSAAEQKERFGKVFFERK